ncbi:acyl-CoA reductase [Robiginitalea sp. M366]|uniref:acyl-CoA reductase n=1 Tax=Robiginitalea aestuariiviva TaxID=3036903 RepID=UPI00240D8737|nr:acyl-CoA reductase [Robiginitalea aestuariiviva]MDG1573001.1 acyl-CoA reductase [Robiginitalea aestuariiviva]
MRLNSHMQKALTALGAEIREVTALQDNAPEALAVDFPEWDQLLRQVAVENPWFTPAEVTEALKQWGDCLYPDALESWMQSYPEPEGKPRKVGLVMAGNIPLVGFHDLLSVLVTGNHAMVRCASNDRRLLPFLWQRLCRYQPELEGLAGFTEGRLEAFDAVIATGSNNTARYFEYYFRDKPHIIRKNRNSIGVLDGEENPEALAGLAADVFRYFGMGCRSISKLMVPEGYDFDPLFQAFYPHRTLLEHPKYANNYDYNKAVYLMSGAPMLDNGFLLLKEDSGLGSPIGTLFYEPYASREQVQRRLAENQAQLQCVAGPQWVAGAIPFGTTQKPGLSDYADGVDTVEFLLRIRAN